MKLTTKALLSLLCVGALSACHDHQHVNGPTIGILEPLEHKAMDEIVAGFSATLAKQYHHPVNIDIENAQNDPNLERAIIQKMRDNGDTIIAPIGMDASEMTLAMVRQQQVISLASDITDAERHQLKPCNVAVVHDEIPPEKSMAFIHALYPKLTQLTLIHSSANKVFPEVQATIDAGKKLGITVHHIMVSSLPELTTAVSALPSNTQGIFILKDHLIVSGVGTLAQAAAQRQIPLITSDQGSVQSGAGIALGVHEREIGVDGGKLAADILNGKSACSLPIVEMTKLTVFINANALAQENQDVAGIQHISKKLGYRVEYVTTGS